jgi:predicted Zn-dependent protease
MTGGEFLTPQAVAERALRDAAGQRIVIVTERSHGDVRFANNTMTTNGVRRDRNVSVISFDAHDGGVGVGIASGSGMLDVADLASAASARATHAPTAEDASELIAGVQFGEWSADAETTDLSVFAPLLEELHAAFEEASSAGHRLYGFGEHVIETTYLATSTGVRARSVQPTGSFELVARSDDGARSTWAARGTPDFAGVSVGAMHRHLRDRLEWAQRRIELPAGRYEVLLPPDAVADLVIELWAAMSGRDAEDGGTVFSAPGGKTRRGERLTELDFHLFSDPTAPGVESSPFLVSARSGTDVSVFDNGASLGRESYIADGTLERLRYHRAGARRSGEVFSPPVDNLLLELPGASTDLEQMIASSERALLLTCLWYIREVDPATLLLTGLTRDGVYLVEHGEVVGAVNNFRFNESPLDLLGKALEVSKSERALSREWGEWFNRTVMPSLRVRDFNMSSVSAAS